MSEATTAVDSESKLSSGRVSETKVLEFGDQHFAIRIRIESDQLTGLHNAIATCPLSIEPKLTITKEESGKILPEVIENIENWFYEAIPRAIRKMELAKEAAANTKGGDEKQCSVPEFDADPPPKNSLVWFNKTEGKLKICISGTIKVFDNEKALSLTKRQRGEEAVEGEGTESKAEEKAEEVQAAPNPYPPVGEEYYRGVPGFENSQVHSLDYGKVISVGESANLRRIALAYDLPMYDSFAKNTNCHGLGLCGTCEVVLTSDSQPNEPTTLERLRGIKSKTGRRLGCQVGIWGPVSYRKPS